VFAHRGGSGLAPENTMAAFANAVSLGADGIELDVHLLADGQAAIIHDATLDRTTDGRGPIASLTAQELAEVDAGHAFQAGDGHPWRGRGCRVPLLRDVLGLIPRSLLLIELKTPDPALVRVVVDDVAAAKADGRVIIGSFHRAALEAVRAMAPHLPRCADRDTILANVPPDAPVDGQVATFHSFQVPEIFEGQRIVTPGFVERAHARGAGVYVWTVDREDDMRRLLSWGVDGLITDRPDIAVPAVRQWWESQ
jgi:glycerophosphoryl diester phosphodiesterase